MNKADLKKEKALIIIKKLKKLFPITQTALRYTNSLELLFAVILSAQCTDKQVNKVTDKLFKKYKKLEDYLRADKTSFEEDIKSTGFYKNKAKNILNSARIIKDKHNGDLPKSMHELLELPGVARKTANIVLYLAYGKTEGIAVDTHVRRLSKVFGLTTHSDPVKIERDLMEIVPKKEWMDFSFRLIDYGRKYCSARKHQHNLCPISKLI